MGVAIFIDLDNIKPSLKTVEEIAAKYGEVKQRWAFANSNTVRIAYGMQLRELRYRLQLTPDEQIVKNDVDNLIEYQIRESVINSIENIHTVVIVSNDNDFVHIVNELKNEKIKTVAVGTTIGQKFADAADNVENLTELMSPVYIGIDLGTTNTAVATANQALYERDQWKATNLQFTITDENHSIVNSDLIPSSVGINWPNYEVGGHVRAQFAAASHRTILAWKHDLGRMASEQPFRYELNELELSSNEVKYEFLKELSKSKKLLPEEAAACILHFCLEHLKRRIREINGVVITHPASFETDAIAAIKKAAVMAGWPEDGIVTVSEPQAALYDYLNRIQNGEILSDLDFRKRTKIIVYDLGGGTLDISMHAVEWNNDRKMFEIDDIAIGSRTRVGGDDFDRLIRDFIISKIKDQTNFKSLTEKEREEIRNQILIYAEKFKKTWGYEYDRERNSSFQFTFAGQFLRGRVPIRIPISYELMVKILEPLLRYDLNFEKVYEFEPPDCFNDQLFANPQDYNTLIVPIIEMFLKVKERYGEIIKPDLVLLNGGVTNFPIVKERLEKFFGEIPIVSNGLPEYAVSRGAALYAAGVQGKIRQRVNPTNIYLEAKKNGQSTLVCIVAQGQKYPYTTTLRNLKLPSVKNGEILFNIWVGMGTKKNHNTTLQRQRAINLEKFKKVGFSANTPFSLKVDYTSDEKLILTAFSPENPERSLEFEVKDGSMIKHFNRIDNNNGNQTLKLPQIQRARALEHDDKSGGNLPPSKIFSIVTAICSSPYDYFIKNQYIDIMRQAVSCSNKKEVLNKLFENLRSLTNSQYLRKFYLNKIIMEILKKSDPNKLEIYEFETLYKEWVLREIKNNPNHSYLKQLVTLYLELIGHLNWNGLDDKLYPLYHKFKDDGLLINWLNALAKTGMPNAKNLQLIQSIILNKTKVGVVDKAIWAFARLFSPLQPEQYRCDFERHYSKALTIIEKLLNSPQPYQIAPNLTQLIYQVAAWNLFGERLPYSLISIISDPIKLKTKFEISFNLNHHSAIKMVVDKKLSLLPALLNYENETTEIKEKVERYLLEITKE
ncbi:MAG: hypothetical protein Kow0037_18260 [Calditrichia bacterium]